MLEWHSLGAGEQRRYAAVLSVKLLEENGWYLARTRGSHRQFKHSAKSGAVTVAGKASIDVPPGTLNSILKQAGLKQERGSEK